MKWIVTLGVPSKTADHSHVQVDSPIEAAAVIQAVNRSLEHGISSSIEQYEEEWKCEDPKCGSWRMEMRQLLAER